TMHQMHHFHFVPYYAHSFALITLLAESIAVYVTVKVLPSEEIAKESETPVGLAEVKPHVPQLTVAKVQTEAVSTAIAADAYSCEIFKLTE
ncbi:hypothetical protein, partial [Klebsiella pneumoniae]|uniref:hypothetical protein n=1 Tax=Klebsiella pneumoniae TaxID=573 RepID=UPI0015E184EA